MTGKKGFLMLLTVLLVSLVFMIFIGGTEPHTGSITPTGDGVDPEPPDLQTPDISKVLNVHLSVSTDEFMRYYAWNERFQQQNPHVKVHLNRLDPAEAYSEIERGLRLGQESDIVLLDNAWIGSLATAGLLLPVDDMYRDDAGSETPLLLEQTKWNGYIWGIPVQADPYMLVWNPDTLREQGWESPPRSLAELEEMEQVLQSQDRYGLYMDANDPYAFASFVSVMAPDWAVETETVTNDDLSTSEPADGLTEREEEATENDEMDENDENDESDASEDREQEDLPDTPLYARLFASRLEDPWSALSDGRIAMMIAKASDIRRFASSSLQVMTVNRLHEQQFEPKAAGWISGKCFAVSASSESAEAALQWIRYMTRSEIQLELMAEGGGMPVHPEAYRSVSLRDWDHLEETRIAIEQGRAFPVDPGLTGAFEQHAAGDYMPLWERYLATEVPAGGER